MNHKIIINGDIYTVDPSKPHAEALSIVNDRITAVGSNSEILALSTPSTEIIDAKQQFVLPGFTDSHIHFLMGGERLNSVQLQKAKTQDQFVETLEEYVKSIKEGEWITGGDWDHYDWGTQLPDRALVDKVTQKNPLWIGRHEGHMYLANTLALQICGIHLRIYRLIEE